MENRTIFKKYIFVILAVLSVLFVLLFGILLKEQANYKKAYNEKIASLVVTIKERYPLLSEKEILDILSTEVDKGVENPLEKFGYDLEEDQYLPDMSKKETSDIVIFVCLYLLLSSVLIFIYVKVLGRYDREIDKLIELIEKINRHNYDLMISNNGEDKISILYNEIYKTTVMLRELADNSRKDKESLKDSLSDISHQLKTPLTSILIMIDALLDDKDMPYETREEFLKDMRREIMNINTLVQSLLKLSRLDVNAITFSPKEYEIDVVIDGAIKNVLAIADLKSVNIVKKIEAKTLVNLDKMWQTEAITNTLKNAIEHSPQNSNVTIAVQNTGLYTEVIIEDEGTGMNKKDLKHIFERFYKGSTSSKDSIGIGLPLAKSIIEKENGKIEVSSTLGKGSKFTIKYFK